MSQSDNNLYEFGGFRLDSKERMLWHGEEMLVLPPKVFDTLLMLVKSEGRIVAKSELMEAIWADAFVEESNLSQNIYTLRRTLGVDESGRQFIETIPRRGYRFAVPVKLSNLYESPGEEKEQTEEKVTDEATDSSSVSFEKELTSSLPAQTTDDQQAFLVTQSQLVSSPLQTITRPHSYPFYAIFVVLGILTLFALGFFVYQRIIHPDNKDKSDIAPIERIRFQRLTDTGDVVYPTISPNGDLLAFVRHEENEESVWVKQIATGNSFQTLQPSRKGYRSLAFSPDGTYLYFREEANGGGIYQTSVYGSTPKKVADNIWSDFSISSDGKQFAFIRRDTKHNVHQLVLSNTDGSTGERVLGERNIPHDYRGTPVWSPDGSKIVVASGVQEAVHPKLLVVDISTGSETELKIPRWRTISRVLWMPNAESLIISARETDESTSQLWMLGYPDGEVRRLTNDLEAYFWLSLSADGKMLVTRQQRIVSHLWLLNNGNIKEARQLTFGERNFDGYVGLAWTPEGKIVFTVRESSVTDIYSMNADGSNRVELTVNAGQDNTYPTASNDGRYIVFSSNRSGTNQIWRMDVDGRNQTQLTFSDRQNERAQYPALSPDGKEVFFIKIASGPTAIWKVSIEGRNPVQVAQLNNAIIEGFLSISPDGKWMAYRHVSEKSESQSEDRTLRIGVLPTDGSAEPKLFDLPMRRPIIQWSEDSTAFYYSAGTFNSSSLWQQPLNGGNAQKLFDVPDRLFNFAWSQDGKHLVLSRGKQQGDAILITNLP